MFIKTLIIKGFKGFKEKTTISFQKGIGAIVGPNGCGKSNVIDAFKWVWGEQKLSDLRSEKFEDLIFNGSKNEAPSNFCEVEVIFDNQKKIFSLDFDEVSIQRRVYRSGESENFINKQKCRLKDIYELLSNTGIGKSNYSVIEQGKIERLFANKLEERRRLFEENAGLGEYQIKKKDYEFKIKKTKENLTRLNDILKVKNKQLEQLSHQAKKSKKYFDLEENYKSKQIQIFLHELYLIEQRIKENNLDNDRLKDEEKNLIEKQKQKKGVLSELQNLLAEQENEESEHRKKIISLEQRVSAWQYEINYLENSLKELNNDFFNQEKHSEKYQEEKKSIMLEIEGNKKVVLEAEKNLSITKKKIAELKEKQKKIDKSNNEKKLTIDKLSKKHQTDDLKKQKILEKEKEVNLRLLNEINEIKNKLEQKNYLKKAEIIHGYLEEITLGLKEKNIDAVKKSFEAFKSNLSDYFSNQNLIDNFFFSSTGTYAKKSHLVSELKSLNKELEALEKEINTLKEELEKNKANSFKIIKEINAWEIELIKREENFKKINYKSELKKEHLNNLEKLHNTMLESKAKILDKKKVFVQEKKTKTNDINTTKKDIAKLKNLERKIQQKLSSEKNRKDKAQQAIINFERDIELSKIKIQKNLLEKDIAQKEKNNLKEKIAEQNDVDLEKLTPKFLKNFSQIKEKMAHIREEIRGVGRINLLAITEYEELKNEVSSQIKEKEDIEKSMENLHTISLKLQAETVRIFIKTLEKTSKNFDLMIKKLFNGGKGRIELADKKNPLLSDVNILVEPGGKKAQKISLFSGGEKSLISLAVMFSLFLNNPSPVCLLDEVDAALDYNNINRLLSIFNEMKNRSQLILISHNPKTMDIIDYMYGISMQNGVSKALSLKVNQSKNK